MARIAFSGAHGVGKTSVIDLLIKKELIDYRVEQSVTRLVVPTEKANFGTTSESQQAIINVELGLFLNSPSNYIAARHMIDRLAYSKYFEEVNNIGPNAFLRAQECLEIILDCQIFDYVFYIPIEFKLNAEGVAYREGQQNLDYQKKIDEYILKYLNKYNIDYRIITGKTPEERKNKVIKILNNSLID